MVLYIRSKRELKEFINSDMYRYNKNISYKNLIRLIIKNPGFRYIYLLRKCNHYLYKKKYLKYYFLFYLLRKYRYKFGFDIPLDCAIDKGFYLSHFGGVVINPRANIGKNINVFPGVTIGETYRGKKKGVPTIGNNVWIGSHAIIIGNIKIGNNVLIGPGAYISFNVPNNSVVIGNPGKIISKKGASGYIQNPID
jgi:serine O-acetyltransferase